MRDIILFIASSLDGFIARPDGSVDWLFMDNDYGYNEFYRSIDVVLMGRKTYEQTLEFGEYPYQDKKSYIFTRSSDMQGVDGVEFISDDLESFVRNLKNKTGRDIWLVGGAEITSLFLRHGLIDRFVISVHPLILGDGIPLFPQGIETVQLDFVRANSFDSGLVQLTYRRAAANLRALQTG